jgi:hypothetical protein
MRREIMPTLSAARRLQAIDQRVLHGRIDPASTMTELFVPLDRLLGCGGDPRLDIDAASGLNEYGCQPFPCPETLSFASSTATSISERAYDRVSDARESLMRSAVAIGIDAAFDARVEGMRRRLKTFLRLPQGGVDVVFSPSGTDAQLQALFLTRARLGPALTTVIVAADQTGSGTADTARGHHFSVATANGNRVRKGAPVEGLTYTVASVALPLLDESGDFLPQAESDSRVLAAISSSLAGGTGVLLQIMDSSKLGWRAPSEECLDEIAARWPDRVQIVVDACQMRLGRARLRKYLDREYMVIVTGSKFFTGPPFSGALLIPARCMKAFDAAIDVAPGLREYSSRSDWPMSWPGLRARFPIRTNFGQWLRWEAALEEMRAYYSTPDEFRLWALTAFGKGVERIIGSSRSLCLLPPQQRPVEDRVDDEELALPTIFPFLIRARDRVFPMGDCRKIYRALYRDARAAGSANGHVLPEIAAKVCLVGQPVALGAFGRQPAAALRICADARLVAETWSTDRNIAHRNVQRELGRVGEIVAGIEWLVAHMDDLKLAEPCHEA